MIIRFTNAIPRAGAGGHCRPRAGTYLTVGVLIAALAIGESALAQNLATNSEPDSGPSIQLRGRIDADFVWTGQSPGNRADFGDLSDSVGLRRARIGAFGDVTDDLRYLIEIDLASGDIVLRDVHLNYGDIKGVGEFVVGHVREPFSLEGGTSANTFAFMERSPVNTLDPARNWGVLYRVCGGDESWTLAGGVFAAGTDSSDLHFDDGSTTNVTLRGTLLPVDDDDGKQWMHVGAALSSQIPMQSSIIVKQRPNSPLLSFSDSTDSPFVPTLVFPAQFQHLVNLEWAASTGSLWAQAEWYGSWIDQTHAGGVFLHGCSLNVGYFLTGEHLSYLKDTGFVGPVTVLHPFLKDFSSSDTPREKGWGAWEATARFAYLDFADGNLPADQTGVRLPQLTVGLNWHLADRMRILFNYTLAAPDLATSGRSYANVFGTRVGMFW